MVTVCVCVYSDDCGAQVCPRRHLAEFLINEQNLIEPNVSLNAWRNLTEKRLRVGGSLLSVVCRRLWLLALLALLLALLSPAGVETRAKVAADTHLYRIGFTTALM